jgi:hypothetical protein
LAFKTLLQQHLDRIQDEFGLDSRPIRGQNDPKSELNRMSYNQFGQLQSENPTHSGHSTDLVCVERKTWKESCVWQSMAAWTSDVWTSQVFVPCSSHSNACFMLVKFVCATWTATIVLWIGMRTSTSARYEVLGMGCSTYAKPPLRVSPMTLIPHVGHISAANEMRSRWVAIHFLQTSRMEPSAPKSSVDDIGVAILCNYLRS